MNIGKAEGGMSFPWQRLPDFPGVRSFAGAAVSLGHILPALRCK